jgi:hypothetical protein
MEKHFEEGRYGSVEITARHPTSIPGLYAVSKELMLPVPNSKAKQKIWSRDALIMYRSLDIQENWHVPFLAPLGPEQRMYHIPLDMFQWPDKIVIRTPDCIALPTPDCPACTDVLIRTQNVPKYLWLELVYNKKSSRRNAVTFDSDPVELPEQKEPEQKSVRAEPLRRPLQRPLQRNPRIRSRRRVTVEREGETEQRVVTIETSSSGDEYCIESDSGDEDD